MTTPLSLESRYLVLFVIILAALSGCAKSRDAAPAARDGAEARPSDALPSSAGSGAIPTVRARAVSVDTTMTVGDVDARARALREATEGVGGYVQDASISGEPDARSGHMELHVPSDVLAPFLAKVSGMGDVTSYNERAEDVTDQRTDLKARLKNARTQEARIQELMTTKTSTLPEIIEAEKELARIRENIERMDAQDKNLDGRVAFATVRVSLQTKTVESWKNPGVAIGRAATNGGHAAASFFLFLAMVFVTVMPTLVPILLAMLATWSLVRLFGRRQRAVAQAPVVEADGR